jgi:hypothetical protein
MDRLYEMMDLTVQVSVALKLAPNWVDLGIHPRLSESRIIIASLYLPQRFGGYNCYLFDYESDHLHALTTGSVSKTIFIRTLTSF